MILKVSNAFASRSIHCAAGNVGPARQLSDLAEVHRTRG
jgi:hypothetical protein